LDDRYRGIFNGRRVVFLNPRDIKERGWRAGDLLDITSHFRSGGKEELRQAPRFVAVPYEIPRRCAATYFPEANVLVPINSVASRSNTPTSKAIVVTFVLSSETSASKNERTGRNPAKVCS